MKYQYLHIQYADRANVPHVTSYDELLNHPSVIYTSPIYETDTAVYGEGVTLPIRITSPNESPNTVLLWYDGAGGKYGLTAYYIDAIDRRDVGNAVVHASVWGVLSWFLSEGAVLTEFSWDRRTPPKGAYIRTNVPFMEQYANGINTKELEYPYSNALDLAVLVTMTSRLTSAGSAPNTQAGYPISINRTPTLNQCQSNPVSFLLAVDGDAESQTTVSPLYGRDAMSALTALQEFLTAWERTRMEHEISATPSAYPGPAFDTITRIQLVPRFMVDGMVRASYASIQHQPYTHLSSTYRGVPVVGMHRVKIGQFSADDMPTSDFVGVSSYGVTWTVRQYGEEICSSTALDRPTADVEIGGSFVNGLNAYVALTSPNKPDLYAPLNLPEAPAFATVVTSWWKANAESVEAANRSANTAAIGQLVSEMSGLLALVGMSGNPVAGIAAAVSGATRIGQTYIAYKEQQQVTRAQKNRVVTSDATIGTKSTAEWLNDPTRAWLSIDVTTYSREAYDELQRYVIMYGVPLRSTANPKSGMDLNTYYTQGFASVRFSTAIEGNPFVCTPQQVSAAIAREYADGVRHWKGVIGLL